MDLLYHRSISPPSGFSELVSFDLGASGDAITTWATAEGKSALDGRITAGPASFPRTSASSTTDAAVVEHGEQGDQVTILSGVTTSFIHTQNLLDGFLVVGSRCKWTPEHVEKNALRFDRSGRLIQEATFGDGIAKIGTTAGGLTWAGYFDEGIFGNFGWGGPGPEPLGCRGINCFGADLRLLVRAPGFDIQDCYAMNVVNESVYACCYPDWRIRHIDKTGAQASWSNEIAGARNILVSGKSAALVGGYTMRNRIVIGRLESGKFRIVTTAKVSLDGTLLPSSARLATRAHEIHALVDQKWYRCALSTARGP